MQLHLEPDELKLLADVLLKQDQSGYADLVDKVLAHDLRFDSDELELTAGVLVAEERKPKGQIAPEGNPARRDERQRRLALLERVRERINEACAMF